MIAEVKISQIISAVSNRGFAYSRRDDNGWLIFSGPLRCLGNEHKITLLVDPEGRQLPGILLTEIPPKLKPVAPHITINGFLCYAAKGSITLDVFDIAGQVLACIDRAEIVLAKIINGEMVDDLEEEFFAYWGDNVCLVDISSKLSHQVESIVIEGKASDQDPLIALTNNPEATKLKLQAVGLIPSKQYTITVRRVKTATLPRPLQAKWPPKTLQELLSWQSLLDSRCRKKLEEQVIEVYKKGGNSIFCLIESPNLYYGFTVVFDKTLPQDKQRGVKNRSSSREVVYRSKIYSYSCQSIDDSYLAQRNTPGTVTLTGRKIALIGCGTIGGYLADLLVKAGAGTEGGQLTLIDNDLLMPQNVGRHRLGFNNILRNKAAALAEELKRGAPTADIRAFPVDVMQANLNGNDLLIDATGEEALGNLLIAKLRDNQFLPYLKVWIEGPGTAIRCLLRDELDRACPRCLSDKSRASLYPVTTEAIPTKLEGHGCESLYVPFSATISVQAACLGAEMVSAWAGENCSPRLRTRILDNQFTNASGDIDPERRIECPACGM